MTKYFITLLILLATANASYWTIGDCAQRGWSMETVCKNGYLTDIITGIYNGAEIKLEQSHCIDTSSWDGDCLHQPIKCEERK